MVFVITNFLLFDFAEIYLAANPEMHNRNPLSGENIGVTLFLLLYYSWNFALSLICLFGLLAMLVLKICEFWERLQDQGLIERLEEKKEIATGDEGNCSICFCFFERGEKIYRPKCGHFFHKECLSDWLK